MLNPFPDLLAFGLIAPFLIRLILGITTIIIGKKKIKHSRKDIVGYLHIAGGILLTLGLYTQMAALVLVLVFGYELFEKIRHRSFLTDGVNYYLILFVLSLSLLLSGAGAFAFDVPL